MQRGMLLPFPPPEEALAYPYTDVERQVVEYHRRRQIVGTPDQVKAGLEALAASYGVDEVVVLTITHDTRRANVPIRCSPRRSG